MSAKEEAQHNHEMYAKETNKNSGQLARAVFAMRCNRKMREFKSAESTIGY